MGIASEIREKLPLCGRCINCKLLIWNDKAELKPTQNLIKFRSSEASFIIRFVVHGLKVLFLNLNS